MAIHGFYVIAWKSGKHVYNRTWVKVGKDPDLLSALIASLEMMALSITSQHVNMITLEDSRFFFSVDEKYKLLFVFITDAKGDATRFKEYLDILSTRFIQIFHSNLTHLESIEGSLPTQAYNELADSLISGWEQGEITLDKAKVMDVLEVFSLFFDVLLQKFLTPKMREDCWGHLQAAFRDNVSGSIPLHRFTISPQGGAQYGIEDLQSVNYTLMLDSLSRTLKDLITLVQRIITPQSHQALFFRYMIPLIRQERSRLLAYNLFESLVVQLL